MTMISCLDKSGAAVTTHADWISLLRARAEAHGSDLALTFLEADGSSASVTYGELDERARSVAAALQARVIEPGDRVLVLCPPGLDYVAAFFGCLYAGAIAIPAYPPRPKRGGDRIEAIRTDAEPVLALVSGSGVSRLRAAQRTSTALVDLPSMAVDRIDPAFASAWRPVTATPDTLAFLQYTSGSTGTPKGVMVTHGNLSANATLTYTCMQHSETSRFLSWLPLYHDMGLIAGVLQPIFGGFPGWLMSPATFLQRPVAWLDAITRFGVTTTGAPNFAYELCLRKVTDEQVAELDLRTWTVAFNGAEPVRADTIDRFTARFARCGFRADAFFPCYGLAEATLQASGNRRGEPVPLMTVSGGGLESHRVEAAASGARDARVIVGCGRAHLDQCLAAVDPDSGVVCGPDRVGEIWVGGPSIAQGYWGRPDDSAATFQARLPGHAERHLRTGDLGFIREGQVFITGRLKDLIVIRGANHYPQDVERTVSSSHEDLRWVLGAALSVDAHGAERLVIVQELPLKQASPPGAIIAALRRAIAEEHALQAYDVVLVRHGTIPLTSSGKIQRRACRARYLEEKLEIVARSTLDGGGAPEETALSRDALLELEAHERLAALVDHLRQALAPLIGVPTADLAADAPLTVYGVDSLGALELKHRLQWAYGLELEPEVRIETLTLAALADVLIARLLAPFSEPEEEVA